MKVKTTLLRARTVKQLFADRPLIMANDLARDIGDGVGGFRTIFGTEDSGKCWKFIRHMVEAEELEAYGGHRMRVLAIRGSEYAQNIGLAVTRALDFHAQDTLTDTQIFAAVLADLGLTDTNDNRSRAVYWVVQHFIAKNREDGSFTSLVQAVHTVNNDRT